MTETKDEEPTTNNVIVKLTSVDDHTFELPLEACKASQLCRDALPEDPDGTLDSVEPIELLRVGQRALEKVVDFLKHHHEEPLAEIPNPLRHATFDEVVTQEWYRKFCSDENLPRDLLAEVLSAANYMSIPPLLDLTCLKFTFQLMGKNADEIREILNLPEMTPEEEQQAREQHAWLFENPTNNPTNNSNN